MVILTPSRCRLPSLTRKFYRRSLWRHFLYPLPNNTEPPKTWTERYLLNEIKARGPLPIGKYMLRCLSPPLHKKFMKYPEDKVFGSRGDFDSMPVVRQIYGELLAIWLLAQYKTSGMKFPLRIIQLGPGKGTLMADILRVFSKLIPHISIIVLISETSPDMHAMQQENIKNAHPNVEIYWHRVFEDIRPSMNRYTMFVAHQFFDSLPVHVLQKTDTAWHEVLVGINTEKNHQIQFKLNETEVPPVSFRRVLGLWPTGIRFVFRNPPVGSSLEVSPSSFRIARKVGELLTERYDQVGGCGLIIDYGADHSFSDSIRAYRNHELVDIFHKPGYCDFTANVNFAFLKEAMSNHVTTHGPIPLGSFLMQLGFPLRSQGLLNAAKTDEQRQEIRSTVAKLVDPTGMWKEHQVMGVTSNTLEELEPAPVWPFPNPADTWFMA